MCLGSQGTGTSPPAVTSSVVSAFEEVGTLNRSPQRYEVCEDTGAKVSQRKCKDCCSETSLQKAAAAAASILSPAATPRGEDEVMPLRMALSPAPELLEVPNLGERKSMYTLEDECRFNASKVEKIRQLTAKGYCSWRPVRGDGNCYYRTVIFGCLESMLSLGNMFRMSRMLQTLRNIHYEEMVQRRAHAEMLRRLQRCCDAEQLAQCVAQDADFDLALIRAARRLVRDFLVQNADEPSPNGLTYGEMILALGDCECSGVDSYCASVVDPMGRDAETLVLSALPLQLGVGLRLWMLDRRDDVDLTCIDTLGPDNQVDVHALFKPGHYDLLYPERASAEAD